MTVRQAGPAKAVPDSPWKPFALLPDLPLPTNFTAVVRPVKPTLGISLSIRPRSGRFPHSTPFLHSDMTRFFAGMVCGALLLFVTMHYHIVHGNNGVVLVPKISNNLSDVYTDIRQFDLEDWKQHKTLAAAIMRSKQAHLLEDSAYRNFGDSIRNVVDGLFSSE